MPKCNTRTSLINNHNDFLEKLVISPDKALSSLIPVASNNSKKTRKIYKNFLGWSQYHCYETFWIGRSYEIQ